MTEAGESVAAKEVFAAAKASANVREGAEYSDSTLKLLASIYFLRGGNQPYEGQVAVGAVVMNRVRSDAFPDTVREVIYQKGQFTPAEADGWIGWLQARVHGLCPAGAKDALAGANPIEIVCILIRKPGKKDRGPLLPLAWGIGNRAPRICI